MKRSSQWKSTGGIIKALPKWTCENIPKKWSRQISWGAFHTQRRDIFCEKDVVLNHFKKEK